MVLEPIRPPSPKNILADAHESSESYVNVMKGTYERNNEYKEKDNTRYLRKPKLYKLVK